MVNPINKSQKHTNQLLKHTHSKQDKCYTSRITFVNHVVLNKHQVGTILDVVLWKNTSLLLEDEDGELLGAIQSECMEIVNRINEGDVFEAELLAINTPASVQIRIKIENQ